MFVGSIAAYYKYGDRTEVTDKSLKGTKEALDGLRAYLGNALAQAVKPTIEGIVANATSPEAAVQELRGESFQDCISEFVNTDIEDFTSYRSLVHARNRWCVWARRISWAVFVLLALQGLFTAYFAIFAKVLNKGVSLLVLLVTFGLSAALFLVCTICAGVMLYHHDQISKYRDKIL